MKSNRTKATHRFQGDFIIRQYVAAGKRTLVFKKRTNKIEDLKRFKLAGYRKLLNRKNKVLILCGFCYDKGREVYLEITRDIKPYNLRTASEYTNYHFSDCPSYCPSNKPINLIKNIETMKSMFAKTSLHDWTKLFNDYSKNKNIPFVKKCLLFDEEEKKISLALLSTLFLSSYASDKEDSKLTKARKKFFFNLSMNSIEDFEKFLEEKKKDLENPYALFKFDIGKYINSANGKMTGFYDEKTESIKICKYNADEGRIYSPFWKKGMSCYRSIKIHLDSLSNDLPENKDLKDLMYYVIKTYQHYTIYLLVNCYKDIEYVPISGTKFYNYEIKKLNFFKQIEANKMNYKDIFICTTDTVCGIGGPINQNTLDCLYHLKRRPSDKKIMILVASIEQARTFKEWTPEAEEWAKKYWPGPYSIIVNDQGFRMPNQKRLLEFLKLKGPMYVTSANISGSEPIKIEEAKKTFPDVKYYNIHNFGNCSGEASKIYNLDTKEWIR